MSVEARGGVFRVRMRRRGQSVSATFESQAQAEAFAAAWIAAIVIGETPPAPPRSTAPLAAPLRPLTVEHACRELVVGMRSGAVRDARGRVYKPSTTRETERRLRLHVLPQIGGVPLAVLRRGDVRRMVDDLAVLTSPATARNALDALRVVIRLQLDREVVEVSVCSGVRVPALERRPPRVLTREEMRGLQDAADADPNATIGPFVALALATGARKGELRALVWGTGGLDLRDQTARISATLDAEEGIVATKNREARDVPLGPGIVARMRRYRLASPDSKDGEPVFPGREPREAWLRIRKAAQLPDPQPRFHDLRHAVCSALRASGMESHEVAAIVGHRDGGRLVDTLYAHALPERIAAAGALMDAWNGGDSGTTLRP